MRSRIYASALAAALAAVTVATAAAQGQVTSLIIASEPGASQSVPVQNEGSTSFWVVFEYRGVSDDLRVLLLAPGGVEVFRHEEEYSGTGSDSVEITGEAIYGGITSALVDAADAAEANISRAKSQQQSRDYVQALLANVAQMQTLEGLLSTVKYEPLDRDSLGRLEDAVDEMAAIREAIDKLNADPEAQVAKAGEMEPHVATAKAASAELAQAQVPGIPIPPSPSADERVAYTVQVRVGNSLSSFASMWIYGQPLPGGSDKPPAASNDPTTPTIPGGGGVTAPGAATSKSSGSGSGTSKSASGSSGPTVPPAATEPVRPRQGGATATPRGRPGEGAQGAVPTRAKNANPVTSGFEESAAGTQSETGAEVSAGAPLALPTWTVPAGGAAAGAEPLTGEAPATKAGSGPDLTFLAVGMLALGAVAFWMRRRL